MDYLDNICSTYVNNILIFLKTKKEHQQHVQLILQKLQNAGLQVDIRKCKFEVTSTTFLGFVITEKSIQVGPAKTAIIRN
jgi:ribosome-interacting GTPase 1